MTSVEQATDEDNFFSTQCPHDFALVDWVDVVDLYTYVTSWVSTFECSYSYVLCTSQCRILLACADAEMSLGNLSQSVQTCLEILFLTLQYVFEVSSQRVAVECRYEDSLWSCIWVGYHCIWTLNDECKKTSFQQSSLYFSTAHLGNFLLTELYVLLCLSSRYGNAEDFTTFASRNSSYSTAYWRNELNFRMVLVYEQGIPCLHIFLFLYHHFWSNAMKIVGHKCICVRCIHGKNLLSGFTFQVDVQAFV